MPQRPIATLEEVQRQKTVKFTYTVEGLSRDGFLLWHEGQLRAYQNLCRHLPLTLDYDDNQFFARDGKELICKTHGAYYDPLTGYCNRGPCSGLSLFPLPITVENGTIYFTGEESD